MKKITKCPYCGSTEGFYYYFDAINCVARQGFNGEEIDNTEMYECASQKIHRFAYCCDCDAKIGTSIRLIKQIEENR